MLKPTAWLLLAGWATVFPTSICRADQPTFRLTWSQLPDLPDSLGVAGPFAGADDGALLVAGGANFPRPVWETAKAWHDAIHVLVERDGEHVWLEGGRLRRPVAYGATVSTSEGVVCMGGNDRENIFDEVFLMTWDSQAQRVKFVDYPSLPEKCAYGAATIIGDVIYLAGGQSGVTLDTAMNNLWALDLSHRDNPTKFRWKSLRRIPGRPRAFNLTIAQHDGRQQAVYVISGRSQQADETRFLSDTWKYTPSTGTWQACADAPRCVMAGVSAAWGKHALFVLGGADGSLFHRSDALRDRHPGFPKQAWAYDTVADVWNSAGTIPQNHVTTLAVPWKGAMVIPSGEIRPRVRSAKVWKVTATEQ